MKHHVLTLFAASCVAALTACGGGDSTTTTPTVTSCNPSLRSGSYTMKFTYQTGTCGVLPNLTVNLIDVMSTTGSPYGTGLPSGCNTIVLDQWTNNNCTANQPLLCETDNGFPVATLWAGAQDFVLTQVTTANAAATSITGTATVELWDLWKVHPPALCTGTYTIEYVK